MQLIGPVDASFLFLESPATPQHVSVMQIFSLPPRAPEDFLRRLVSHFRGARDLVPPWNQRLARTVLGLRLPAWTTDPAVDLEYHVRFAALPRPGGERELGELVSQLHGQQLDPGRPMWECTLIEGLENERFALFMKMHHSMIDGVSALRLMGRVFTDDPDVRDLPPPWAVPPVKTPRGERPPRGGGSAAATMLATGRALLKLGWAGSRRDPVLRAPYACPNTPLNGRITPARRIATQQYELSRLKAICKRVECSINDLLLYLCGTALRRFLTEAGALPEAALSAGLPVSVRSADDQGTGNAISFMLATLATDVGDPRQRLAEIVRSTAQAKAHLQTLPRQAQLPYVMLMMGPSTLQQLFGFAGRTPPNHNVTVSNVPGPVRPLYLNGARMEAMYPLGMPAHGLALNITCLSYAGTLNLGLTSGRDALPHMQRIAVYMGEALQELEEILG